jgi:ABC-2 type transport system permease protein
MILAKPLAFVKRDFLIAISYRLKFVFQMGNIFVSVIMLFFLSKLVGGAARDKLAAYGGDYFSFVLIGVAFADYLTISLNNFAAKIRTAQLQGTLEALLVTPSSVATILLSSSLYDFLFSSMRVLVYLVVGLLIFGMNIQINSFVSFIIVLVLTISSFAGIGFISAAFIIAFKQGSPIGLLAGISSSLLGGVFYPISVLPAWLKPISHLLPITHGLEAMRRILLKGASMFEVRDQISALCLFAIILFPLGLGIFSRGLKMARRDGSLIHY